MHLEIERKYLLSRLPTLPIPTDVLEIDQGYLGPPIEDPELWRGALRRVAPTSEQGARGGVEEPQGAWTGAVLSVGRRRAPRATDAAVEGGLRAPDRTPAAERVRRCVRIWSITAATRLLLYGRARNARASASSARVEPGAPSSISRR